MFIYTFQRLYKLYSAGLSSPVLNWLRNNKKWAIIILCVSLVVSLSILIHITNYSFQLVFVFSLALMISTFYVIPIFGKSLREIPGMKSLFISMVWVTIMFIFPWLNELKLVHLNPWSFLAYFFLFHALALPFDIRDIEYDKNNVKTLPILLGKRNSQVLAIVFLIAFASIIAIINPDMRLNIFFWATVIFQLILISLVKDKISEGFFILVDATMILIGLSYFIV